MTDATLAPATPHLDLREIYNRALTDAPIFTRLTLALALALIPALAAMAIDPRMIEGVSVWLKPTKFLVALALFFGTIAIFARWASPGFNTHWATRAFAILAAIATLGEMLWIGGAAALGTTSHFNVSTPMMENIYALMGLFAVTLTASALIWGIAILRHRTDGLGWVIGLSLIATFVATLIAAGTLSAQESHFIGTPVTGAAVPIMGWSREVGDLRVAHFLATHVMHIVPLAALLIAGSAAAMTKRHAILLTALVGLTIAFTYLQALQGLPLIPV